MTEASDDWMDDDVGLTMDDEDDDVKVEEPLKAEEVVTIKSDNSTAKSKKKGNGKKDKTKQPDQKIESKQKVVKPETKPKKEAQSDDIDSVLDDWLNGDDEIPEELPEVDVKTEKKDLKSLKTQKANEILSNMNKLSGIMDDRTNTNIQGSVENFLFVFL